MYRFSSVIFRSFATTALLGTLAYAQAPAAPAKIDPNSPANIGRAELVQYLDSIAAQDTATRHAAVAALSSRAEAEDRQAVVRKKILSLIGGLPERTPLNAKTLGVTQANGFRIEKILFESQPGFPVTALLYLPDGKPAGEKLSAVLIAPGHGPAGKASDYFTAATFARNGFVVLSYDPIGQGERLQYPDPSKPDASLASRPTGEHGEAGLQPSLIGDAISRYFVWDAMRGIDYLSQRPEVDPKRIGAFGCSGGGAMTALTGALDTRVAATAVACYNTSFDTLLASIGPQDGEQSIPGFIAAGLDFPDWIELVAPRPYAAVATYSDMFPFAGARTTVSEARRFYALFDPASAGMPSASAAEAAAQSHPTAPALNIDTPNAVPLTARLQFITGPGGHGALSPIMGNIVGFFLRNLQPGSDADHPLLPPPIPRGAPTGLPKDALQVTSTGQVATSYPHAETIFTLNLKHAAQAIPSSRPVLAGEKLAVAIRETTGAKAKPGASKQESATQSTKTGEFQLETAPNVNLRGTLSVPPTAGRHPAVLLLAPESIDADNPRAQANKAEFEKLTAAGNIVLAVTPSPSPAGTDDMKSPILGPFYLLSLRAELVKHTLVGMRVDDVIRLVDALASRPDVDASRITAIGSGHMGLVLLHAAVLDARLKHITIDHVLSSYHSLLEAPLPIGASEDIIPGVLLHYDIPDLAKALGTRLTETEPLKGTDDLSQTSTPLETLRNQ
ncbi:alpha/beta hydrolase family protein [Granulicella mallensis]|uniref:Acetyl xylan esterase n=1 Tax=Granulicella mallensis (strain ATCC BAA-1857 / DSM 23137 / MP5ACTX8) TaxID=682795 RepID=G8NXU2_GRAMM|nr:acetylxylan esterase [Granulicella mallensis]AEU34437.1 Acetyl xylan esterase [Granulicella mallensis MP5ACTX8]